MEHRHSVLIVEDDPDIRELFNTALEDLGCDATTAENGVDALDRLEQMETPCLILLDLMMPVMTGQEFLKAKQSNEKIASVPVVVISAVADASNSSGAQDYFRKPVDLDTLAGMVERYCSEAC